MWKRTRNEWECSEWFSVNNMNILDHRRKPKVIWSFLRWKKYQNVQRIFHEKTMYFQDPIANFWISYWKPCILKITTLFFEDSFPTFWRCPCTHLYVFQRRKLQITLGFLLWSRIFMLLTENHSEHSHSLRVLFHTNVFRVLKNSLVYSLASSYGGSGGEN